MSAELCKRFGLAVRRQREMRRWSQEELAEQSDLNRSYIGEIERGRVIASIVTAHKLGAALGLGLAGLFAQCEQQGHESSSDRNRLLSLDG